MPDVDALLIDKLWQPLADRLGDRLSCFDLARLSLDAAIALEAALLAWDLANIASRTLRTAVVIGTLMAFGAAQALRGQIARAERRARPGMMNLDRVTLRPVRLLWVGLALFCAAGLALSASIAALLNAGATLGWIGAVYLMCCVPMPPTKASSPFFQNRTKKLLSA